MTLTEDARCVCGSFLTGDTIFFHVHKPSGCSTLSSAKSG